MDSYVPELSMLRLKRRRNDEAHLRSHLPRAKKVMNTPTVTFDFILLPAGQYIEVRNVAQWRIDICSELRNRIYEYTVAEVPSQLLSPVLYQNHRLHDQCAAGIALTQVSHQVRSEYRPMWLERAKFVIDWHSVHAFLESFYPNENEYGSGPKKLVVQYEPAYDCTLERPTEIIHLVRLGLAFKGLEVRVVNFDERSPAGISITKLVQYGSTCLETVQQDAALVKEAKRKWRVAVQEYEVKSVAITMRSLDEDLNVHVKVSRKFASTMGSGGLDGLWHEIVAS